MYFMFPKPLQRRVKERPADNLKRMYFLRRHNALKYNLILYTVLTNAHTILDNVQTKDKIDDVNLSQPNCIPRLPYLLITLILSFVSIVFQYFSGKSCIADEAPSVLDHKYKRHAKDITISYDVVL